MKRVLSVFILLVIVFAFASAGSSQEVKVGTLLSHTGPLKCACRKTTQGGGFEHQADS